MKIHKHLKALGLATIMALAGLTSLQAQPTTWTGASGGEWNTAGNWNNGVPNVGINALINAGANVNYNLTMSAASFGVLTNDGILNLNNTGFNPASIIMINPGGTGKLYINNGAVATLTGNLALSSNNAAALAVGSSLTVGGSLIIGADITGGSGGTATISAYGSFTNYGGALNVGSVTLNPRNQSIGTPCLLLIKGGTNNLGAYSEARTSGGASAPPTLGTDGLVINGGYVNTTSISIGNNAHGILYLTGGVVTNTGTFTLRNATATRPARFNQTGGFFVTTDPSLVYFNDTAGGDTVYSVAGGTNLVGGFEFGSGVNTGTTYFTNAATIYVGSQGMTYNGVVTLTSSLNNGGSFGATANWSSPTAMRLFSGIFTFNPSDLAGIGHTITWSGVLSGAGGLLVTNAGTVVLSTTNNYTGNTTIGTGGTLQLGDGSSRNGVVVGNITNNGTLTLANPNPQTISGGILGSGSLVANGTGTLILGTNAYTGNTTISAGTLQLGDGATYDGFVPGNITNNATLTIASPTAETLSGTISGSGSVIKSGAGILTLATNETYTGNTTISAGNLVVASGGSLGSSHNVTISSGSLLDVSASTSGGYTLASGYTFTAGHTSGSGNDFNGNLTSAGTVNVPANATFTLNGNLSLANGGTSEFNLGASPGSGSTITLAGGTLTLSGTTTIQVNFSVLGVGTYPLISGAGSVTGGLGNLSLSMNGSLGAYQAALAVTATGVNLVVNGNPHNLLWLGDGSANSWDNNSANTDWSNLVTQLPDFFATGYYVTFNDLGAANQPILNATVSPAYITINGVSNYTFSGGGYINSGTLTNNSTGTIYIQTANTYNGGTVINAGTVEVDSGGALGTGPVQDNTALTFNNANGNTPGAISGSGSLTVESGSQTLSAANTYAGGTTISSGTLQVGAVNAVPGGTVGGDVTNNGTLDLSSHSDTINALVGGGTVDTIAGGSPTLTLGANGDSGVFTGIIQNSSGTLSLAKTGAGAQVLDNVNTYSGNTTIANGTLTLGANNSLPITTTVTLGGAGTTGILDLGGYSQQFAGLAAGVGALGTNQIIGNSSTSSAATLIITNGGTITYSGAIQDSVGGGTSTTALTLSGGELILNGTNAYSGATLVNSGGNTLLAVTGGSLSASTLSLNSANVSRGFLLSAGTASFSGAVTFSADNGNNGNLFAVTGGTLDASSLASGRTALNLQLTTVPTTGQTTTEGIYVNGGVVNVTNTLRIGGFSSAANSSASFRMDTGAVNVGGTTILTINNVSRWSVLDIDGGTFTSTDSTGAGIQLGGVYAGASTIFLLRGGTVYADTLTFGDATQTSGTNFLNFTGGTLYLGAGGIVLGNTSPTYTSDIAMGTVTVGALANWTTTLPIALSGTTTFQAADNNANPFNITLNGVLSGSAKLNKSGGGTLALGAVNTYTGNTTINAGTLALGSGGSLNSPNLVINTNAILDVSQVSGGFTLNGSQTIKGVGTVNGLVTAAASANIDPGSNVLTGTLTFAGGLTENGGVYQTFYLTANPAAPNGDLISVPGTLTVSGSNPIEINGSVQAGGIYPLFTYGTFSGSTANFTVVGANGTLSNSASAQVIYFVAQSNLRNPTNTIWLGSATNDNWDSEISTNWLNTGTALPDYFVPGDSVLFSNLGATNSPVTLVGTLTPGSITLNTTSNYTFTGTGLIGGTGGLTISNGVLTILTTNTYTGPTVINNGTLATPVLAVSGLPSGIGATTADPANLILNAGTFKYYGPTTTTDHGITVTNGGATFDVAGGTTLTLSGTLTGSGTLTKVDNGTLILPNATTLTGATTIGGGVLEIENTAAISTSVITFSNGTLAYNPGAGMTVANPLVFTAGTTNMLIVTSGSGANPISSGTWTGGGLLIVSNTFNPFTVNGVLDAFTGTILLASPNGANFRFNSGGGNTTTGSLNATFDLDTNSAVLICRNAGTMNLGALSGGVNTSVVGQGSSTGTVIWSIGNNNLSTTFSGVIKNDAANQISSVTKVGAGTLTLAGQNTYTGATTIFAGALALAYNPTNNNNGSIADTTSIGLTAGTVLDVTGRSDATFPLGSSQTLSGPGLIRGSLDASGPVTPGGSMMVSTNVTLESSATVTLRLFRASSPNSDRLIASNSISYGGTLTVNNAGAALQAGDTFTLFPSAAYAGTFSTLNLPTLTGNRFWNTSNLAINGTITVAAPTPPAFSSVAPSGSDLVLNATNGTPNASVTVLTTTDLTLPLAQWTTVTTGNFDGNGNFNYTVSGTLTSGQPQQFFLLQQ